MRIPNCLFAAGALLACLLGGCTTEPAKLTPEANPYLSQGRVQFESHTTDEIITVARIDSERVGSGLLKVVLTLRNTTKDNLWAEIRTTFLDGRGHKLEDTNWEPVQLNARTVSEYTCTSISPKASDYQVIIRKPSKTAFDKP
jgi:hypothetical protein